MKRPDDHVVYEELAAGFALSALEPEEEQTFREHLVACARCEGELAAHGATLEMLSYACEPAEPPAAVLQGIRARLSAGRPAPLAGSPFPREGSSTGADRRVVSLTSARERRAARAGAGMRWVGVAAAASLVLALGSWNLTLRADREQSEQYSKRLAVAVQELARPDSRSVPLAGQDDEVVAVAVVKDSGVSLVVDGLEPNDSATTYVLWAQDAAGVRPVEAFDVDAEQVDVLDDLQVEGGVEGVTAFHLSEEPGDLAPPQPRGPVIASGQV